MMTGTGIVPDGFTLAEGDQVKISIEGIGVLENKVGRI
jgi:2-dehydro-3-deoxy-D-arabinonate dehydratase